MANAGYVALVERDWDIPQGADTVNAFRYGTKTGTDPVVYPDFVADGWTARAQFRSSAGGDVWVTFLSSALTGPRIILEDGGYITMILPSVTSEDPAWNARFVGFYDLELIKPTGFVIRLARGQVNVTQDYTRTG